jgi:hypothetical protein
MTLVWRLADRGCLFLVISKWHEASCSRLDTLTSTNYQGGSRWDWGCCSNRCDKNTSLGWDSGSAHKLCYQLCELPIWVSLTSWFILLNYLRLCHFFISANMSHHNLIWVNGEEVSLLLVSDDSSYRNPLNHLFGSVQGQSNDSPSHLAAATMCIMSALQTNLDGKSKLYRDPALTRLFLMNNIHHMVWSVIK